MRCSIFGAKSFSSYIFFHFELFCLRFVLSYQFFFLSICLLHLPSLEYFNLPGLFVLTLDLQQPKWRVCTIRCFSSHGSWDLLQDLSLRAAVSASSAQLYWNAVRTTATLTAAAGSLQLVMTGQVLLAVHHTQNSLNSHENSELGPGAPLCIWERWGTPPGAEAGCDLTVRPAASHTPAPLTRKVWDLPFLHHL